MYDKYLNGEFDWGMIGDLDEGRANLGGEMPVSIYRLFQSSMRATLVQHYGTAEMIQVFIDAGRLAGSEFARNLLDLSLSPDAFAASLQAKMKDLQMGVLRFEHFDTETGKAVLTVGEDLDCSGLPVTGECVCNYDEGFISGVLSEYMKKPYVAVEVDCWAKGDRVCRFEAAPQKKIGNDQ